MEWLFLVVQSGADPNVIDHDGMTPMHFAATRGHRSAVETLCRLGANLHGLSTKYTPFFFAVAHGHSDVVRSLLERGIDPNMIGVNRRLPLHIASSGTVL